MKATFSCPCPFAYNRIYFLRQLIMRAMSWNITKDDIASFFFQNQNWWKYKRQTYFFILSFLQICIRKSPSSPASNSLIMMPLQCSFSKDSFKLDFVSGSFIPYMLRNNASNCHFLAENNSAKPQFYSTYLYNQDLSSKCVQEIIKRNGQVEAEYTLQDYQYTRIIWLQCKSRKLHTMCMNMWFWFRLEQPTITHWILCNYKIITLLVLKIY